MSSLFLKKKIHFIVQLQIEKMHFNTSFTELALSKPTVRKHLILTNVEESRPNIRKLEVIIITALSMNGY